MYQNLFYSFLDIHLKTKTKLTVHGLIDQIGKFKTEFSPGTETGNPSTWELRQKGSKFKASLEKVTRLFLKK